MRGSDSLRHRKQLPRGKVVVHIVAACVDFFESAAARFQRSCPVKDVLFLSGRRVIVEDRRGITHHGFRSAHLSVTHRALLEILLRIVWIQQGLEEAILVPADATHATLIAIKD